METGGQGQATGGEGGGNEQPNVFAEVFAGDENAGGGGDGSGAAAGSKGDQAGSGAGGQRGDTGAAAGGASGGTGDGKGGEGQGAAQSGEGQGTQGGQQQAQGGQQQGGQQQQPKQYTQEELDKYFKVWKPDVKFIERILGDDKEDALKAVLDMRDGLAEQCRQTSCSVELR
jgi:hypothetical protein